MLSSLWASGLPYSSLCFSVVWGFVGGGGGFFFGLDNIPVFCLYYYVIT